MISASIVLYKTKMSDLEKVYHSYAPAEGRVLFLIDNSPNMLIEEVRNQLIGDNKYAKYIYTGKNIGYGSAHNIAIEEAIRIGSKYHVILNPDLCFVPSIIDQLQDYADQNKDVVYILPRVEYPDGRMQYLCKLLPTPADLIFRRFLPQKGIVDAMNKRYELRMSGYDIVFNPPCLSGCFMFLRVDTLKNEHLRFDSRYFMYCEDFDFMRRLHRTGKTIFYPYATIIHNHAQGSYKNVKMLKMHISSAIKYFNKFGWFYDPERRDMNRRVLNEIHILKMNEKNHA